MTTPTTDWTKRWQELEGQHWVREAERYDTIVGEFGDAMLDAADLKQGERVLDVGCGNGATTIEAAQRVRPGGVAVGIDLSAPMLGLASQRAAAAGATETEFVRDDAQVHAFTAGEFDAVVSRFGVMFFDDPEAAFANLGRAVRRGGRLAFVAWQGIERSQMDHGSGARGASRRPPGRQRARRSRSHWVADPHGSADTRRDRIRGRDDGRVGPSDANR